MQQLHAVGKGCPDLLVGFGGRNLLMEVKDGEKPPSARKLTAGEAQWHEAWRGRVHIIESPHDALRVLTEST